MFLVVFIVDKELSGKVLEDAPRYRAGDVIEALPDSHRFSKKELANPNWRIIYVPGPVSAEGKSLMAREPKRAFEHNHVEQRRGVRLDIDILDAAYGGKLLATRTASQFQQADLSVSVSDLRAAMKVKPPLIDPRFVGPRQTVIG